MTRSDLVLDPAVRTLPASILRRIAAVAIGLCLGVSLSACEDCRWPRDGGPPKDSEARRVVDSGLTLLCPGVPAWLRYPEVGSAPGVDRQLRPGELGHFGNSLVQAGIIGPPVQLSVTAGGGSDPVEVGRHGLRDADTGLPCEGVYVARRPDRQVVVSSAMNYVRIYAITRNGADPVLLVRRPDGRWRCNNNHGQSHWGNSSAAALDFCRAIPGLYTVWVGTADGSANNPATLYVTGNPTHHP